MQQLFFLMCNYFLYKSNGNIVFPLQEYTVPTPVVYIHTLCVAVFITAALLDPKAWLEIYPRGIPYDPVPLLSPH